MTPPGPGGRARRERIPRSTRKSGEKDFHLLVFHFLLSTLLLLPDTAKLTFVSQTQPNKPPYKHNQTNLLTSTTKQTSLQAQPNKLPYKHSYMRAFAKTSKLTLRLKIQQPLEQPPSFTGSRGSQRNAWRHWKVWQTRSAWNKWNQGRKRRHRS